MRGHHETTGLGESWVTFFCAIGLTWQRGRRPNLILWWCVIVLLARSLVTRRHVTLDRYANWLLTSRLLIIIKVTSGAT